jgi:CubicO group peptidase (beta-lactamase class C family)
MKKHSLPVSIIYWLLSFAFVSLAQAPSLANPATRQLTNWLAAYDSPDWSAYLAFVKKNFATQPDPMFENSRFRQETGGFDLKKIEAENVLEVTALIQEHDSDVLARIVVKVEEAEPHRIRAFEAHAIARPPDMALARLDDENELIASLRERIQGAVAADKFAGAVLVAKNSNPIFAQAYGLADRERHIPNTLQTRFRIGSMNKMFTAVATLQLAQRGKLKLDDPVGKYLTDYPNKELASKVTIRELLSHTGGTGDFFGPEFDAHRLELRTHEDYVKLFGNRPVRFEPGSRWEYSNYGFLILGAVIDQVSGQNYFEYVRDHVYTPAGMSSTGSEPENYPVPDRSVGYTKDDGSAWHPNTHFLPYRGMSAGGGYTTVGDLLRFANALQQNKLLDPHDTRLLTTGHVDTPGGGRYGYGFGDRIVNGVRCFGHAGGSPGMNGDLEVCPDVGYVVVALANIDPPAAQYICEFIVNRLPAPKSVP